MSEKTNSMILDALSQQEDWIATLTFEQQKQVRVHMALIELAIKNQPYPAIGVE